VDAAFFVCARVCAVFLRPRPQLQILIPVFVTILTGVHMSVGIVLEPSPSVFISSLSVRVNFSATHIRCTVKYV
jgi:hypothetical protein